jgi:hypothetical protein
VVPLYRTERQVTCYYFYIHDRRVGAIGPGEQGELAEYPDHREIGESY